MWLSGSKPPPNSEKKEEPNSEKEQKGLDLYPKSKNSQYKNVSDSVTQEKLTREQNLAEIEKFSQKDIEKILKAYTKDKTKFFTDDKNECPKFFAQMKNSNSLFADNTAKQKMRKDLMVAFKSFKDTLWEGDSRIADIKYFIDKFCICYKECDDIKGGKRKTKRRGRKTKKTRRKRF